MKYLLSLVTICILLTACKKESATPGTQPTPPKPVCHVKAYTNTYGANVLYEYSPDGRLIKMKLKDGRYTTYTYTSTALTITEYDKFGAKIKSREGVINSSGRIIQIDGDPGQVTKFTYNGDGFITLLQGYENSVLVGQMEYKIVDGNVLESVYTSSTEKTIYTYEYFYDKENKGNLWEYDYEWMILAQKPYKNLISKIGNTSYTYVLNADGLPTKVQHYEKGTFIKTTDYTFECQ